MKVNFVSRWMHRIFQTWSGRLGPPVSEAARLPNAGAGEVPTGRQDHGTGHHSAETADQRSRGKVHYT